MVTPVSFNGSDIIDEFEDLNSTNQYLLDITKNKFSQSLSIRKVIGSCLIRSTNDQLPQ